MQRHIRILGLLPYGGDVDAPIKCELRTVALEAQPKYEALSYVWGESSSLVKIELAGRLVSITPSLLAALQRLRLQNTTRSLWIDQLCINQWDNKDKARQVQLMGSIYSQCQECLVWFGEVQTGIPCDEIEQGLRAMESLAAAFYQARPGNSPAYPLLSAVQIDCLLNVLQPIKEHPWWRRIWTVQEAVLPRKCTFVWGPHSIAWDTLTVIRKRLDDGNQAQLQDRFENDANAEHVFNRLEADIAWLEAAKAGNDTPAILVKRWRFRNATDNRDKIYGLQGLSYNGSFRYSQTCDYDKSAKDVFSDLTYDLILSEGTLFPLILDPRLEASKSTPDIPCWAVDIAHLSDWHTDWTHVYCWPEYRAHGGRQLDQNKLLEERGKMTGTLRLSGVFVDVVEHIGESWLNPDGLLNQYDLLAERIDDWRDLAQKYIKRGVRDADELYPGGYMLREAFGRLILGDFLHDEYQVIKWKVGDCEIQKFYEFLESKKRNDVYRTIKGMTMNQRFFITKTGLMGLGHMDTEEGDEVWVFDGGNCPFTIHPREANGYEFGGRCYVQGIMFGEALTQCYEVRDIALS